MNAPFAIRNVRLLEDGQVIPDGLIRVADGRIHYAGPERAAPRQESPGIIDGQGGYVTPGFVDLQFNGGYGRDFTENLSALLDVACRLPETGVAAFLPTFITGPLKACPAILRAVASAQAAHRKCWPVFNCSKRCAC